MEKSEIKELALIEAEDSTVEIKIEKDLKTKCKKRKGGVIKKEIDIYQRPHLFSNGVLVYAKMRGHREWPGIIMDYNTSKKRYIISFFGTGELGEVPVTGLYLYCDLTLEAFNWTNASTSKKSVMYATAEREIEQYSNSNT